jgi:recombination protein RecR
MQNISEIEDLVKIISKLPGLGPKSAKRIVLKLINNRDKLAKPMAKALTEVCKNIVRCNICGTLKPNLIECSYSSCEIVKIKFVLLKISLINGVYKVQIYLKDIFIF